MKVYTLSNSYASWIDNCEIVREIEEADVILFPGGGDVSPELYDCKNIASYGVDKIKDLLWKEVFDQIDHSRQLALGICKGAQFLCVMNDGRLIQDVDNHAILGTHTIVFDTKYKDYSDKLYDITSTHHQMMYPFCSKNNYEIIAVAYPPRSTKYIGDKISEPKFETEIVWFPDTKSLCVQGHPEMLDENNSILEVLNNLLIEKLK